MPILLKLYMCLGHGLKLSCDLDFYKFNLVIFMRYYIESEQIMDTLNAKLLLQFYADSLKKLYSKLGHGLKICMCFLCLDLYILGGDALIS